MRNNLYKIVLAGMMLGICGASYPCFVLAARTAPTAPVQAEWPSLIQDIENKITAAFTPEGLIEYNRVKRIYLKDFNQERLRACISFMVHAYAGVRELESGTLKTILTKETKEFIRQLFSKGREGPVFGLISDFMYAFSCDYSDNHSREFIGTMTNNTNIFNPKDVTRDYLPIGSSGIEGLLGVGSTSMRTFLIGPNYPITVEGQFMEYTITIADCFEELRSEFRNF